MTSALARLERALFFPDGSRRLPRQRGLDLRLAAVSAEELFWFCETRPRGPIYLLPTQELVARLGRWLSNLAGRRGLVLEVGAGDGFLSAALREACPSLRITATDSGAWEKPTARMSAAEQRRHGKRMPGLQLGPTVERREALAAVRALRPEVVLAAWLPPGPLLERLIRSSCRYVVEIGADGGVTGQGEWAWRFAHAFGPPAVDSALRSRLDARGARLTHATCYFGRQHEEFHEERPRRGDWLWQFRP